MTARKRPPLESLHHALKSWDPVRREGAPPEEEVARWRRRTLAAEGERRRGGAVRWRPVLVSLAAVLVLVVLWEDRPRPEPPSAPERPDTADGEGRSAGRPGTAPGLPRTGDVDPGAAGGGASRAGGEEGRGAVERGTPGGGTAPADASSPPPARPVETGHPDEGTVGVPVDAASRRAETSTQVELGQRMATVDPPPAAPSPSLPPPGPAATATAAPAPAEPPAFREVQIIAPGGTRIVWLVAADPASPTDPSQEDT